MNLLKNKTFRLSIVSILTGGFISVVEFFCAYFMAKGTAEWTLDMDNTVIWISTILALVLFIVTAIFCFRDMTRKEIAQSAIIVVIYYILIVILEQMLLSNGAYPTILLWLFVPVRLYSTIHQVLLRISENPSLLWLIPSFISPFLYVIFGRKNNTERKD